MQKKRLSSTRNFLLKSSLLCCLAFLSSFTVQAQCDNVDGGNVSFPDGNTETTILIDGNADVLTFETTVDAMANNHEFTYVVTDVAGIVLGVPPANMTDFEPAGLGLCRVFGLSYTGNLNVAMGDDLFGGQDLSDDCFDLSANHLKVSRVAPAPTQNTLVASSNLSGFIGVYAIQTDGAVLAQDPVETPATDADGIAYDAANDKLYQLSRNFNRVYEFSNFSTDPTLTATTGANEFENGREIAVVGNKIVVAQDANEDNGNQNRFYIYDIAPGELILEKVYDADINLWGIHGNGSQLFAVQDNSNNVAVYDDFFNQPAGAITPTALVAIDDLVRTHGITYDAATDRMFLTDIGDAMNANDGAIISIKNWSAASADGVVDASEQSRAKGGVSLLGNPVDIAYDSANEMVYVAERANGGGRILGFKAPAATGGIAPSYKRLFEGASAVFVTSPQPVVDPCDFVDGGTVSLLDGNTEITTVFDGEPDVLTFTSSVDAMTAGHSFTYVITDADGMVLGIPPGNMQDFDPAGLGACGVYGLSYTGNLTLMAGDDLFGGQPLSDDCFDLSDNSIVVTRVEPANTAAQLFASTNNGGVVGVFDILENGGILSSSFAANGMDADGIHYDQDADVLYQLDRTNNIIVAYSDVNASLSMGNTPPTTAMSTSDFMNGREIAVSGSKLVVADDGDNNFVVYDISPTAITLDKVLNADINLWGIQFNGDQLIAISDNTNEVATYDDFLNQPAGAIAPTATIVIEGLVRTHGVTYDAEEDYMLLTDVGEASSPTDGALFAISNWTGAIANDTVSMAESVSVSGASSFLGNPVDVAYDKGNSRVYVAERANGGGRILCFKKPAATGGIAPVYNNLFAGASAVNFFMPAAPIDPCTFVDGGTVALPDGNTSITTVFDGEPDVLTFTSSVDAMTAGHSFTYVITDADGIVLGIPMGDSQDFDPAGLGACGVYGLSYTGNLTLMAGDDLFGGQDLSDDCFDLSDNSIVVTRVEPSNLEAQLFASSNNGGVVGVFNIQENGAVLTNSFTANGMDSDGIHYDQDADVLYQLDRTNNVIVAYSDVNATLAMGGTPAVTATSSSDFMNGREIAVNGSQLVVADDVDMANKFVVYDISPTAITLNRILTADINLWGIHANGDQLIAISDNTNEVAIYDDFFNQPAGPITPTATVVIDELVRTHGITYDAEEDYMLLTDVGSGMVANDGALFAISNWTTAIANDTVSTMEAVIVDGASSFLGNPVDVAYDKVNSRVYVAERLNGGGRILCFKKPAASGGIAPVYNNLFAGASAVNFVTSPEPIDPCAFVDGGTVALPDGNTEITTVFDGNPDVLTFTSSVDAMAAGHEFTYVITDADGIVLGIPMGDSQDFDPAGLGACGVYGLSYTGNLTLMAGDDLFGGQDLSDDCFDLSDNSIVVTRVEPSNLEAQLFASSNNGGVVGVFNIQENGAVLTNSFTANGMDADGIHYDQDADVLYQLDRTNNVIVAYSDVNATLAMGGTPAVTATSSSDFMNGREIAVNGSQLVVADDVDMANKFVVYDISPTAITLNKILTADINLWGIHANGDQLIAISDNTNEVAIYDDFFNQPAGPITPTATVVIDELVRTHGITYDAEEDYMLLTDVGSGMVANDGALFAISNWTAAIANDTVSTMEAVIVDGASSFLGNPVDVAYDKVNSRVYVAERLNGGGRILCFKKPAASGGIAPVYNNLFAGASAVNFVTSPEPIDPCAFVDGGTVALPDGNTEATTVFDGNPDVLTFTSSVDAMAAGHSFTYVITDADGIVLGIPMGDSQDFDPAGLGACGVYGLSYTGNLTLMAGDDLFGGQDLSDDCFDLSDNSIVVTRVEPSNLEAQLFASSNNGGVVGVYGVLENGATLMSSFSANGMDADGIYYDTTTDVLYQLDRTNNVIVAYSDVNATLALGGTPVVSATSSSDFINGREIAVNGNQLVVADDVDMANKFVIYDISPTAITLNRILTADINLWGIHANGDQLIAISDNTNEVAIYDDFFNQPAGPITPTATVVIDELVRTHGITYDAEEDYMLLTDVGSGMVANDGALFAISNWTTAIANDTVSTMEAVIVDGPNSFLGNPVDVAYDKGNSRIYIAERLNGGGRILGFKKPVASGGIAPVYNNLFAGASAVNFAMAPAPVDPCAFVDGGTVALSDGNTEITTVFDGNPDVLTFTSSVDAMTAGHAFTYVITDDAGIVLGIPMGDSQDFDPAGLGACNVYGLSYTGALTLMAGDDLFGGQDLSDDCFDLSDNSIVVTRVEDQPVDAQLFVSSGSQTQVGTYEVLEDGSVIGGNFDLMNAMDSDGIHYDKDNDVLYQVNRSENRVDVIGSVSTTPTLVASSTPDLMNGRGITISGSKLVVADDVDMANRFIVYDITPTSIMLDKILLADINLWGIHADGDRMIAISDNTSDVAVYDDFFNQPAGAIVPTTVVTIADMVRTHGLDYDAADDMLILTDVGSGMDDNDGALVVVRDFAVVSADGMVDASEQARVFGGADFLGNPVDVALDKANKRIYVAERANGGGRLLGFNLPKLSGGIAPFYNALYPGAASVFIPEGDCDFVTGGAVTFDDGTTMKDVIVNDGMDDELFFVSDVDAAAGGYSQTFVVTDGADGNILGVPGGNSVNFETSGVGACRVYNVSYTGTLMLEVGDNLFTDPISDGCGVVSDNFLVTNRTENFAGNGGINGTTATSIVANVFPVPVANVLNIRVESSIELNGVVNIFDAAGNRILQDKVNLLVGENTLSFDVATFENGMYFVQLPGSNEVTKFVKMKK